MWTVVHLDRAKEHSELVICTISVKLCNDQLEVIYPLVSQMEILDEYPISCNDSFGNGFLDCLVESLAHLEVVQLGR